MTHFACYNCFEKKNGSKNYERVGKVTGVEQMNFPFYRKTKKYNQRTRLSTQTFIQVSVVFRYSDAKDVAVVASRVHSFLTRMLPDSSINVTQ